MATGAIGPRARAEDFCARFGLTVPVLQAPMAGACPPELAVAVARAGGMAAAGHVQDHPDGVVAWAERFRQAGGGPLLLNLWVPDPPVAPELGAAAELFLTHLGGAATPAASAPAPAPAAPDFAAQCDALLRVRPTAIAAPCGSTVESWT